MKIQVRQIPVKELVEWLRTYLADTMGSGWTWPPGPKTKACRATLGQSV